MVLADKTPRFTRIADRIRESAYSDALSTVTSTSSRPRPYGEMMLSQVMMSSDYLEHLTKPFLRLEGYLPPRLREGADRVRLRSPAASASAAPKGAVTQVRLHIGTHKTGSTALQDFLHAESRRTGAGGVLYPRAGCPSQRCGHSGSTSWPGR